MNTGKEPFKCGLESAECGVTPQFDFRHRQASCASPCEIMPAPRLPIVSAVFHRASHAPRCPCGIRKWGAQPPPAVVFDALVEHIPRCFQRGRWKLRPWRARSPRIVHPKLNSGKEPFKCGMESAERGVRPNVVAQASRLCVSAKLSPVTKTHRRDACATLVAAKAALCLCVKSVSPGKPAAIHVYCSPQYV